MARVRLMSYNLPSSIAICPFKTLRAFFFPYCLTRSLISEPFRFASFWYDGVEWASSSVMVSTCTVSCATAKRSIPPMENMLSLACFIYARDVAVMNLSFNLSCRAAGCVRAPGEEEESVTEVPLFAGLWDCGRRLDGGLRLRKLVRSWSETFWNSQLRSCEWREGRLPSCIPDQLSGSINLRVVSLQFSEATIYLPSASRGLEYPALITGVTQWNSIFEMKLALCCGRGWSLKIAGGAGTGL